MEFESKKLGIETLGEYLARARKSAGLDMRTVSARTGIAEKFLFYLEAGEFHSLPADVYVRGFLKKLARIYRADEAVIISQYRKERSIVSDNPGSEQRRLANFWNQLAFTPKTVSIGLAGMVGLALVGYLFASVVLLDTTPSLEIHEPSDGIIVKDSAITVAGVTDPGAEVLINDQKVFVDTEGRFKVTVGAAKGQADLVVRARNRFGKELVKRLGVVVEDPQQTKTAENTGRVELSLKFTGQAEVRVEVDGNPPETKSFTRGEQSVYEGTNKIVVTTDNAGAVQASLNGQEVGVLGRAGETLTVEFSSEADFIVRAAGAAAQFIN